MIFLEITQMVVFEVADYWYDIRNIIDLAAYLSMVTFCVMSIWLGDSNQYLFILATLSAGLKAIMQLRCFDSCRWLIEMIMSVFGDMMSFLYIVLISNFVFALL